MWNRRCVYGGLEGNQWYTWLAPLSNLVLVVLLPHHLDGVYDFTSLVLDIFWLFDPIE